MLSRMIECRPLAMFSVCFLLGAVLAGRGDIPLAFTLVPACALILCYILLRAIGGRRMGALLIAAGVFLGGARMTLGYVNRPEVEDRFSVGVSGTVADDPLLERDTDRLICRLTNVTVEGEVLDTDVRLYLRGSRSGLARIAPGQIVRLTGHVRSPGHATNPGAFDFSDYLWRKGVGAYVTGYLEDAEISGTPRGMRAWLSEFRGTLSENIGDLFPQNAALVRALVLGDRNDMPEQLREDFNRAGVTHLLAISGLHVSLLASAIALALRRLIPRRAAFLVSLGLIVFYGALVGMAASVVRAILMFAFAGFGEEAGRPRDLPTRISAAMLVLLLYNPLYLFDAGFVLSFSAVAGIFCLARPITSLLCGSYGEHGHYKILFRARHSVASMIGVTLSAQLATLPAVAAFYGSIPLLATLTNLLAIPITMCALPVSIVALAVSTVWPWGGAMLAAVADGLLSALTFVTRVGAALPLSGVKLTAFPGWLCALYALTVVLLSDLSALRLRVRQWLLPVLLVLTAVPVVLAAGRDGGLEILFLDAGQADAAAIWAEGELYLMDVGLEDTPVDDYLVWRAATPKAIFLSHPHDDHAGGLGAVLAVCRPETIYLPAGWNAADADADALEHLRRAGEMGCDLVEVCAGDRIQLSQNVEAEVLFPFADASSDSANEISMLVCVRYFDAGALFTGDLPIAQEPGPMPDIDVLKVAHHGSDSSTSLRTIYSATPSVAVISVGANNSYGHPAGQLLRRVETAGAQIYRTDLCGAVTVRLAQNGDVYVRTHCSPED